MFPESLCCCVLLLSYLGFFPLLLNWFKQSFPALPFPIIILFHSLTWLKPTKYKFTFVCPCGIKIKKDCQVYVSRDKMHLCILSSPVLTFLHLLETTEIPEGSESQYLWLTRTEAFLSLPLKFSTTYFTFDGILSLFVYNTYLCQQVGVYFSLLGYCLSVYWSYSNWKENVPAMTGWFNPKV